MAKRGITRDSEAARAAGKKGGARTAELRRQGKVGGTAGPLADAKKMAADIMRWKDED